MSAPHTAGRPLRVLIVDDERLPRQRLLRLLEEVPNTECVGECANGRSTVEAIESLLPAVCSGDKIMAHNTTPDWHLL